MVATGFSACLAVIGQAGSIWCTLRSSAYSLWCVNSTVQVCRSLNIACLVFSSTYCQTGRNHNVPMLQSRQRLDSSITSPWYSFPGISLEIVFSLTDKSIRQRSFKFAVTKVNGQNLRIWHRLFIGMVEVESTSLNKGSADIQFYPKHIFKVIDFIDPNNCQKKT